MKKSIFSKVLVASLACCICFSSCIGSFGLHRRILTWNQEISSKFVNELVFLVLHIIPVYEISYLVDILVINSIEFWSGDNPMANIGDIKKVKGENGNYLVETTENGYYIQKEGEETGMELVYDQELNTWNVVADGVSTELLQLNNDGTAQFNLPGGEPVCVTLDEQGMADARQALGLDVYYAYAD